MARLTRKNIKVFAESASNNGVFGSLQAGNPTVTNDVESIQSLSEAWSGGWNYATLTGEKLPPLEEFQGIQYVTTYQQAYLMQEGLPEWSSAVTYFKGCLTKKVTSTGFQIYNSLTDNNTNNQLSDTANWKLVMDSSNLYALDNDVVHLAGTETITGEKTFSAIAYFISHFTCFKNSEMTYSIIPSESKYTYLDFTDSNDDLCSRIYAARYKEGGGATVLQLVNRAGQSGWMSLNFDGANNFYASAPASDVNGSIVTTLSRYKAQNGYFKLGNGLIVQWGKVTAQSQALTITLPTAFTTTNYSLGGMCNNGKAAFSTSQTTTTFALDASGGIGGTTIKWIAIGY